MLFLRKSWKILRPIILNKYLITLIVFGIIITFFDNHNLIQRRETQHKIKELEQEYEYYKTEIKNNKEQIHKLRNDKEYLERFAREKYHMKSDDEEIFVIKE
jgi:cell division protein FtsB